jgi:hypothetical protein
MIGKRPEANQDQPENPNDQRPTATDSDQSHARHSMLSRRQAEPECRRADDESKTEVHRQPEWGPVRRRRVAGLEERALRPDQRDLCTVGAGHGDLAQVMA